MKGTPDIGARQRRKHRVTVSDLIAIGAGDAEARVFATPRVVLLLELVAKDLLAPFLEPGEETVGSDVSIEHLAPTPEGAEVEATAELTAVDGRRYTFAVSARDEGGEVARGTHQRAVIETAGFRRFLDKRMDRDSAGEPGLPDPGPSLGFELQENHATLTLNRPARRNAIDAPMTEGMERILDYFERRHRSIRVLMVRGAGGPFSAGEDVAENANFDTAAAVEWAARRARVCRRLAELPVPSVAAVDGVCMGGGMVLAAACDIVIATPRSRFALPEARLGWSAPYGFDLVAERLGPRRATTAILTAREWSGREAEAIGLADIIVSPAQLDREIDRQRALLEALPGNALAEIKRVSGNMRRGAQGDDLLRQSLEGFARCREHPNATEGMEAFLEKRRPRFTKDPPG